MRSAGSYSPPAQNLSQPLANFFADEWLRVFGGNNTTDLELVGNSIGGNLAMAGTIVIRDRLLQNRTISRLPTRLTLIDPYWPGSPSSASLAFLADQEPSNLLRRFGTISTQEFAGIAGELLQSDLFTNNAPGYVFTAYYRTSILGSVGHSARLSRTTAFIELSPDYAGSNPVFDAAGKHTAPVMAYLASISTCPGKVDLGFVIRDEALRFTNSPVCSKAPTQRFTGGANISNFLLSSASNYSLPDSVIKRKYVQSAGFNSFDFSNYIFTETTF